MNRIQILVQEITQVMSDYNQIAVYRSSTQTGIYTELTTISTRIDLVAGQKVYYFVDETGGASSWYKSAYYDSVEDEFSASSDAFQISSISKIGYTFRNYTPPENEWGTVLTADDMRFTYLWGIDLKASDISSSEVDDDQLLNAIEESVTLWEDELDIIIRKRIFKTDPLSTLNHKPSWEYGVDYTDEEDPYDFEKIEWNNFGFVQLRHRPVLSVEECKLYDRLGNQILDLIADHWMRVHKFAGQLNLYPSTGYGVQGGYVGTSIFAAYPAMFGSKYPDGIRVDYTCGYKDSDFVPKSLRNIIGMTAALAVLGWIGDGLLAGFSSSSLSLDGLSESFSSTQSATSAYFGARIKSYLDQIKEFRKTGRLKFGNVPFGIISS